VRSQNPKELEAALKHACIMESYTSTKEKKTEAEKSNAMEKPEKQLVEKYGGRVRPVTGDGEIQTTEVFVRQVVERIQGVIEAKLTPTQYSSNPILSSAYAGLSYEAFPFYPATYANVSLPQATHNIASVPQPSVATQQNVSELATTSPPSTVKIHDTNRRCWICNSEQYFSPSSPNKVPKVTNATQASDTNNKPELNHPNELCRYCKKTGHTVKDCYKLANKILAEDAEKLRTDFLQPPNAIARVVSSERIPKPLRDKFVYIAATINGNLTNCLCDSGCDVNLLPVHFVNLNDVLPSDCKLHAAGGTPIEVLGHCKIPIQLENGFLIDTDFIVSPSIKEPMLGIEWLTKNAVRWNFLDGTIIIQDPTFNVGDTQSSHADPGKEMSVRSVSILRDDCARLTSGHVVLPISTSPVSKEVLFHEIDKICNAAKTKALSLNKC